MGCVFVSKIYDGKLSKRQLADRFASDQQSDRHEHGTSYSGSIGMLTGLEFLKDGVFPTERAAAEWLDKNTEKWGAGGAVRAKKIVTKLTGWPTFGGRKVEGWGQHAYDITLGSGKPKIIPADQLTADEKRNLLALWDLHDTQQKAFGPLNHELNVLLKSLTDLDGPFDEHERLAEARRVAKDARDVLVRTKTELEAYDKYLCERLYVTQTKEEGEVWVVGGQCAS